MLLTIVCYFCIEIVWSEEVIDDLFRTKIKFLLEAAYHLDLGFHILRKVEIGERKARSEWIPKLAQLLISNEDELITAWPADRDQELAQDEKVAKETIKIVATKMGMKIK